jgi:hypothetical protein
VLGQIGAHGEPLVQVPDLQLLSLQVWPEVQARPQLPQLLS